MRLFRQAYVKARGMIYNAMPEMELANRVYDFTTTEQICMGIGMDTRIQSDAETFRKQYHIDKPFLLYAGRKDVGKTSTLCCGTLLNGNSGRRTTFSWC